jgi:HlyD family secretion protein
MTKKKLATVAGGTALVLATGWWWYGHRSPALQFRTARVERGEIQSSISATGNCNAVVTVQVGSLVSGNIKALYADFNTKVKKGQLVAEIDPQLFQARVDQARANLDSANAAVMNAQASLKKAEADIASAVANVANQRANVARMKSALEDAKVKFDRRVQLTKEGVLSREDLDTAQATYDQAVAQLQAVQAQLDAAQKQVQASQAQRDVVAAQVRSAQSDVKQMAAALAQAETDIEHTRILAPVDGTVIARRMDVGQTVAASFQAPTIFEIAQDLTKMQVDTNVDEADIGRVAKGQPVTFTVDAYPSRVFHGFVSQIRKAPINVQNVVTYDVVVAVANPDLKLYPGMTANVRVLTDTVENALKIPNSALRYRPPDAVLTASGSVHAAGPGRQQPVVWVLGEAGKPRPVGVKLGITDGNSTQVVQGDLRPGEQVIVGDTLKGQGAGRGGSFPRMRGPGF